MYSINKYIIILLIFIILFNITYFNINKKNIEKFDTFINENSVIKAETRPCTIYLSDNVKECDILTKYYNKGITQLDILINKYSKSKNKVDIATALKLKEIKEKKLKGTNDCKIELKEWKEISKNIVDNIEYPYKTLSDKNSLNVIDGYALSGTCFKNIEKFDNFIKNENVKNIIDVNDDNDVIKKGINLNLENNIDFTTLNKSVCDENIVKKNKIDIPESDLFIRLKCKMKNDKLIVLFVDFAKFNNSTNNFDIITNNIIIQKNINKLFRYYYDINNKNIMYGSLRIDTNCYIINYDNCNKVNNFTSKKCTFSFTDFGINKITIGSYNGLINSGIPNLDDEKNNYEDNIHNVLNAAISNNSGDVSTLVSNITTYNNDIVQLDNSIRNKENECNNINNTSGALRADLENRKNRLNCNQMPDNIVDIAKKSLMDQEERNRLAREQAERDRLAREQAERDRLAREQADRDKLAREKADRDRLEREKADRDRLEREQAERDRLAREKEERDRLARDQAERDRLAREQADRIAREQAEKDRLAREQAEKDRLAREQADRIAREQAEKNRLAKEQENNNIKAYHDWNNINFKNKLGRCCNFKLYKVDFPWRLINVPYLECVNFQGPSDNSCRAKERDILNNINPYAKRPGVSPPPNGVQYKSFTNQIEKFTNANPMMPNPEKKACLLEYNNLQNQLNNFDNSKYNNCVSSVNNIKLTRQSTINERDRLVNRKNEMSNKSIIINNLKNNMNKSYNINDIKSMIKDKEIQNIDNYIDNISNDDYLYIKLF